MNIFTLLLVCLFPTTILGASNGVLNDKVVQSSEKSVKVIEINSLLQVNENLLIPDNVILRFVPGGLVTVAPNVKLTIDGTIEASAFRIFDVKGHIAGSPKNQYIMPEWFYAGAYDDDNSDWSPAINQAINFASSGCRKVLLFNKKYNVNYPINLSDGRHSVMLEGSTRSTQYEKGTMLIGNTGRGNPVVDTSNSDGIFLKNIGISRGKKNPSDIGLLQARCAGKMWAGDQYHDNLYVNMQSDVNANNGFGTIGVINIAGEETRYHNLQVWANLPLIISWTNGREKDETDIRRLYALRCTNGNYNGDRSLIVNSPHNLIPVNGYSNSVFVLSGLGRLVAYDYVAPCVLINMGAMVDLGWTFMQKRKFNANSAGFSESEGHVYAVEIWNCFQFNHHGSIEGCRGYIISRRGLFNATAKITLAGSGETRLPIVMLMDDGSNDTLGYHTELNDCRFSFFSYDKRPLVETRNAMGKKNDSTRFRLVNCDVRGNVEFDKGKSDEPLMKDSFGNSFYYSDAFLLPDSTAPVFKKCTQNK